MASPSPAREQLLGDVEEWLRQYQTCETSGAGRCYTAYLLATTLLKRTVALLAAVPEPSAPAEPAWDAVTQALDKLEEDIRYGQAMAYDVDHVVAAVDQARALAAAQHQQEVETLRRELDEAKREIALDDQLLASHQRILDACPCPVHGPCIPHVLEQLDALAALRQERDALQGRLDDLAERMREGEE